MKYNKDNLQKNLFWMLLGGFALFWLIGMITLRFSAGGKIATDKKKFEDTYDDKGKKLKNVTDRPKNQTAFTDPWNEHAKKYEEIKNKVWQQAFELQNPPGRQLMTWPEPRSFTAPEVATIKASLEYPSAQTDNEAIQRYLTQYKDTLYIEQFKKPGERDILLDYIIAPVEIKGLKDGFEAIMAPATGAVASADTPRQRGGKVGGIGAPLSQAQQAGSGRSITSLWNRRQTPTFEEAFLAQEDLWIKRDLLDIVKEARDSAARLAIVKDPADKDDTGFRKKGNLTEATFRNSTWEVKLIVEPEDGSTQKRVIGKGSTIKNIGATKRTQDLGKGSQFRLRQRDRSGDSSKDRVDTLTFDGEQLAWNQEPRLLDKTLKPINVDLDEPFELEQEFRWDTCPIKRVDDLKVGYHSHRTAATALKPGLAFPIKDAGTSTTPTTPAAPGRPGAEDPGAAAAATDVTEINGLQRNRYVYVTEECRHVPIAMVLVIDQAHIHDVLAAVANSRLRIQTTQIHYQQTSGVRSEVAAQVAAPAAPPTGSRPPLGPRSGPLAGPPPTADGSNDDPNLIELSIYGIASIYERFPPRKPADGADANATAAK